MRIPTRSPLPRFFLLFALGLPSVWATAPALAAVSDAKAEKASDYVIRVELRETENRQIEGTLRGHTLRVDQPKAFGGDDTAATPPETLAFALGACVVSTARLLAMQQKLPIEKLAASVRTRLDFARALGEKTAARAGLTTLGVTLKISGPLSVAQKEALLRDVAGRCPLCDTVQNSTPLTLELAP